MTNLKTGFGLLVALSLLCFCILIGTDMMAQRGSQPQSSSEIVLTVNDPRPLAKAADFLELKFGIAISYEDVAWSYGGDIARLVDTPYGREIAQQNPQFKAVIPRGGSFDVKLLLDPVSRKPIPPVVNVLQNVLTEYTARGNPGEFKLVPLGQDFSIVPNLARDQTGRLVQQRSPLDVPISFPEAERDGLATLRTICEAVTAAFGKKISPGTLSVSFFSNTLVRIGANNETARDVLAKVLEALRWQDPRNVGPLPKLSWRLFYGPDTQYYSLNVKGVEREEPTPAGGTRKVAVSRSPR
jgi:hypothetical protein